MPAKPYQLKLVGDKPPPQIEKRGTAKAFPGGPGHLICPAPLEAAQSHPDYIPDLPIRFQHQYVQDIWWEAVFAERGMIDPAPLPEEEKA
jgi:hypothetical protein